MFHGILVHIVQSCQPRFLERQASFPKFVHDSPAGSGITAVKPYRQFAVQMLYEITMRCRGIFEADHEVIMINEEGPRLQNERIVPRQFKCCIAQKVQLRAAIKKWLSMEGCCGNDVSAVRREMMWRSMRPSLAQKNALPQELPAVKALVAESDARTHRTPKALRAKTRQRVCYPKTDPPQAGNSRAYLASSHLKESN